MIYSNSYRVVHLWQDKNWALETEPTPCYFLHCHRHTSTLTETWFHSHEETLQQRWPQWASEHRSQRGSTRGLWSAPTQRPRSAWHRAARPPDTSMQMRPGRKSVALPRWSNTAPVTNKDVSGERWKLSSMSKPGRGRGGGRRPRTEKDNN